KIKNTISTLQLKIDLNVDGEKKIYEPFHKEMQKLLTKVEEHLRNALDTTSKTVVAKTAEVVEEKSGTKPKKKKKKTKLKPKKAQQKITSIPVTPKEPEITRAVTPAQPLQQPQAIEKSKVSAEEKKPEPVISSIPALSIQPNEEQLKVEQPKLKTVVEK